MCADSDFDFDFLCFDSVWIALITFSVDWALKTNYVSCLFRLTEQLRHKELTMLCFLKDVTLDRTSLEITVKTLM